MKGLVNSVSLVNLNQAGHHCGLQAELALVSGRMKCHRFVVTALPR
jgi:hypothetical protein